jgi:hypothetical protein
MKAGKSLCPASKAGAVMWSNLEFITIVFHYPFHISFAFNKHLIWSWFFT